MAGKSYRFFSSEQKGPHPLKYAQKETSWHEKILEMIDIKGPSRSPKVEKQPVLFKQSFKGREKKGAGVS